MQRQAFGTGVDMIDQPAWNSGTAHHRADQFACCCAVQPLEHQAVPRAAQEAAQLRIARSVGRAGGHDCEQCRQAPEQPGEQSGGGRVEPVHIVKEQVPGGGVSPSSRSRRTMTSEMPLGLAAPMSRRHAANGVVSSGRMSVSTSARVSSGSPSSRASRRLVAWWGSNLPARLPTQQLGKHLTEREIGGLLLEGLRRAKQAAVARPKRGGVCVCEQSRLADPRFRLNDQKPPIAACHALKAGCHHADFSFTAEHRAGGARVWQLGAPCQEAPDDLWCQASLENHRDCVAEYEVLAGLGRGGCIAQDLATSRLHETGGPAHCGPDRRKHAARWVSDFADEGAAGRHPDASVDALVREGGQDASGGLDGTGCVVVH